MVKRIGILYGRERSFPPALIEAIQRRGGGQVVAEPVKLGPFRHDEPPRYELVVDRISHDVPFYRTWLKMAAAMGAQIVNNPFWWSADDKLLDNVIARAVGVAVPRTVVLPHKEHPPNTSVESFSNLEYPLNWPKVFDYVGFPMFLKPAYGGGWRDVYKVESPEAFFDAYGRTHSLTMLAQEAIEFTEYYRCYGLGRERVRVMRYDPKAPFENRYVRGGSAPDRSLLLRIERDTLALCRALGYDFNTVEFAVRDGLPYAIDFMNPAPDCDLFSVGEENFNWVVANAAEVLIERVLHPRPLETTGSWPGLVTAATGASS